MANSVPEGNKETPPEPAKPLERKNADGSVTIEGKYGLRMRRGLSASNPPSTPRPAVKDHRKPDARD